MIISVNKDPHKNEFDILINSTINELNVRAKKSPKKITNLMGRKLEPYVRDLMSDFAIGTPFQDSIELIGGQKFPDIIARKFYGIEVKTTTQNHWKTTGNSVLESTRVDDIERIFMLFAKLSTPVEFRCRPYEEVLSEVVVTHSPRYLIDMDLEKGNTIFDKIKLPYDTLRKKENPIKPIVDYYKNKLKPGDELWWMDSENNSKPSNVVIRVWNNLSSTEKHNLIIRGMAYFPELFSNRSDKFGRFAIWLATREAVVCPNVRDLYSAGGVGDFKINNTVYKGVSRIFLNLFNAIEDVKQIVSDTPITELMNYWNIKTTEKTRMKDWITLVSDNSSQIRGIYHVNINSALTTLITQEK